MKKDKVTMNQPKPKRTASSLDPLLHKNSIVSESSAPGSILSTLPTIKRGSLDAIPSNPQLSPQKSQVKVPTLKFHNQKSSLLLSSHNTSSTEVDHSNLQDKKNRNHSEFSKKDNLRSLEIEINRTNLQSDRSINMETPSNPHLNFPQFLNSARNSVKATRLLNDLYENMPLTTRINHESSLNTLRRLPIGEVTLRLENLQKLRRKLSAVDVFDKPLGFIQPGVAKYKQTMDFLDKSAIVKQETMNMKERMNFVQSPTFNTFLNILQDRPIPKLDQESFYVDLANMLEEEGKKRNHELRFLVEEQSNCFSQEFWLTNVYSLYSRA